MGSSSTDVLYRRNRYYRRYELILLVLVVFSIAIGAAAYRVAGVFGLVLMVMVVVYVWSQAVVRS